MEIGHNLNLELAGACPTPTHRTFGVPTGKCSTDAGQLHLIPNFERADSPRAGSVTCQRAPVGNTPNDKQRSDDLLNQP